MVVANEASDVLFMDIAAVRGMISVPAYAPFIRNLIGAGAADGYRNSRKLAVLSCYEIGDRILLHLKHHFEETGERSLSYSPTELALYLGVNRAALYRSIGKLVEAGRLASSRGELTLV